MGAILAVKAELGMANKPSIVPPQADQYSIPR
jgi:hypothetical protein